jgi:hypothetical protein
MAEVVASAVSGSDVDVQVEPRMVINPTTPSIDIYPGDPSRDEESAAFGDIDGSLMFTVRARVSTADNIAGQDLLLSFMDDTNELSVSAALLEEPTLNGVATSIDLESKTGYVLFPTPDGAGAYLGCLWVFMVLPAYS